MKFGHIQVKDASGTVLGHSVAAGETTFKKGRILSDADVEGLLRAGVASIIAARLGADDIQEDAAAGAISSAVHGSGTTLSAAQTGRANIYAEARGLAIIDKVRVDAINMIHESITLATLSPFELVASRQMLATIKIIPFAAPAWAVEKAKSIARDGGDVIRVAALAERKIELISTTLPGMKHSLLDKNRAVIEARAEALGSKIINETRCAHAEQAIAAGLKSAISQKPDLILIFGAAATIDRGDTVPEGIALAGGTVLHLGMPVDPGNLLVLGQLDSIPVIGLPGCARSPKLNGLDFVLQRLCAGLSVTPYDLMGMGVGGLLKEIPSRPQPRDVPAPAVQRLPNIAAIVLAAGRSTRMGDHNKLLLPLHGVPLISRTVTAVRGCPATAIIVVTGHDAQSVTKALDGQNVTFVHNPRYGDGMSTSLRAGIAALPSGTDGILVCLGDMPAIRADTIAKLIEAYDPVENKSIVVPTFQGKRGHPVLFAHFYRDEMLQAEGDGGARALLSAHSDSVYEVETSDAGVLADADTPAAFAALEAEFKS